MTQTPGPTFFRGNPDARAEALQAQVDAADAAAKNARQMVLNRDPRLATLEQQQATMAQQQTQLEQLANTLGAAIPASDKVHQDLRDLIAALTSRVAAVENKIAPLSTVITAVGQTALTGSLLAGATQSVVVTLSRNMGSATYYPGYSLSGGTGLLGGLSILGVTTQTATTVTLQVKNTALLGLTLSGGVVTVVATREV